MEPAWMKNISNATVCNFFYFFFVLYALFTLVALITMVITVVSIKKLGPAGIAISVQAVLTFLLGTSFMGFHYLVCDRALMPLAAEKPEEPFMGRQ
jgi:hypothetical protein